MTINERINTILNEFNGMETWEDRYKGIINKGKQLAELDEKYKTDDYKVKGCQSQVWIHAELDDQKNIIFKADSDAMIVKGLVAVLVEVYSGASADEVLSTPPDFLKQLGFQSNLSPNRANGLYAMLKQIIYFATAFKIQAGV